jgi:hypothetical protein
MCREQEKGADKLGTRVPHPKSRKNMDIKMCPEIFNL